MQSLMTTMTTSVPLSIGELTVEHQNDRTNCPALRPDVHGSDSPRAQNQLRFRVSCRIC
jgi:hypothetical protein